jgi:predicted nucleic acid binding AN1-type Zn finger protein
MIFLVALLLGWDSIVQSLRLKERIKGVGDGTIEGHRYIIVQHGDQIFIELPDHPREQCEEIVKKILQKLKPSAEIKVTSFGYVSTHCNYCLLPDALLHKCHRCDGWYCNQHRLPEQHNCPDDEMAEKGREIQQKNRDKEQTGDQREQIIVSRVPCG